MAPPDISVGHFSPKIVGDNVEIIATVFFHDAGTIDMPVSVTVEATMSAVTPFSDIVDRLKALGISRLAAMAAST